MFPILWTMQGMLSGVRMSLSSHTPGFSILYSYAMLLKASCLALDADKCRKGTLRVLLGPPTSPSSFTLTPSDSIDSWLVLEEH